MKRLTKSSLMQKAFSATVIANYHIRRLVPAIALRGLLGGSINREEERASFFPSPSTQDSAQRLLADTRLSARVTSVRPTPWVQWEGFFHTRTWWCWNKGVFVVRWEEGGWGVRGELLMERQKHGPDRRDAQRERGDFEALFFKKQMTTRRIKRRQRLLYSEILFNLDFFSLWQKISD